MPLTEDLLKSRARGFALLTGDGIEVGAFNQPSKLPASVRVRYVDAISRETAVRLFPEADTSTLVTPSVIADLDRDGLSAFPDASLDFVVMCHVLEHLSNPLWAIAETFRTLKPGGRAALAIPDKRFTYDQPRPLTGFGHLWSDFLDHTLVSSDDHYLDFLSAVSRVMTLPPEERGPHVEQARTRREHAHVWDSDSFRDTVLLTLPLSGHRATLLYESHGDENHFEYFSVWEKR